MRQYFAFVEKNTSSPTALALYFHSYSEQVDPRQDRSREQEGAREVSVGRCESVPRGQSDLNKLMLAGQACY